MYFTRLNTVCLVSPHGNLDEHENFLFSFLHNVAPGALRDPPCICCIVAQDFMSSNSLITCCYRTVEPKLTLSFRVHR